MTYNTVADNTGLSSFI